MSQEWDFRRVLIVLTRSWWKIASAVALSIVLAWLYLRYTTSTYISQATIQIDFSQSSFLKREEPANMFIPYENIADSYIELFTTHDLVEAVVRELSLNWEVYSLGKVGKSLTFPTPFWIEVDTSSARALLSRALPFPLYVELKSNENTFSLRQKDSLLCQGTLGEWTDCKGFRLRLASTRDDGSFPSGDFLIRRVEEAEAIRSWQRRINILSKRGLTAWVISVTDISPVRAQMFLQKLLKHARAYEQVLRQEQYTRAIEYVDTLLLSIRRDLNKVQDSLFVKERLTDMPLAQVRKERTLTLFSELEQRRLTPPEEHSLLTLEAHVRALLDTLASSPSVSLSLIPVPVNINKELASLLKEINQLIDQRERLMRIYVPEALPVVSLTQALIKGLRQAQHAASELLSLQNELRQRHLQEWRRYREGLYKDILSERQSSLLQDDISLRREIYKLLLEKRIQLSIDKEAVVSAIRISQPPSLPDKPLSPNPIQVYIVSLLLGLLLSVGGVLLWHLIYQQVSYKVDLEGIAPVPIIGELPYHEKVNKTFSHSGLQLEILRSLRSALGFLWERDKPKVLVVTSTVSGEGKSYVASGLAYAYTLSGCKVLIIDADLRRASLTHEAGLRDQGLSMLLSHPQRFREMVPDYISPLGQPGLYLLPAGPLPPNPTELLESSVLRELVEYLSAEFEIIVIDTAPLGLVPDTLGILRELSYAITLYVFRADYSKLSFLSHLKEVMSVQHLRKVYLLFNGTRLTKPRYGYGYGYGYYAKSYTRQYYETLTQNGSIWRRVRDLLPI
ncbi:MAG: polysaccharide biosynthesis tyrosine autokinase [Bacteroidia bacterium]|nr:polysaccharide biosynthesis tyrosine autokinase [Bacteroidia bacterium]